MPHHCSAFGCTNSSAKKRMAKNISFHRFPLKNKSLMKVWLSKMKRTDDFIPNAFTKLCSDHFEESCFERQNFTDRRQLKKDAVPTKFIFAPVKNERKRTSYTVGNVDSPPREEESDEPTTSSLVAFKSTQTTVGFSFLIDELEEKNRLIDELQLKIEKNFNPDYMLDELESLTGFDPETFNKIYDFLNLEEDLEKSCMLTPKRQFFLFMLRLRKGITLDLLAYNFKVSVPTASRIFKHVTSIIYNKVREVPIWPEQDQIQEWMHPEFMQKYPRCRVIIDCTEIDIQKPESPTEQQMTFSNYKNRNTAKALVGIAPSGAICFISRLFTGCASDKFLFCKSKLLDFLQSGDMVLADKGFIVGKELEAKGCELVQPLFLANKIQFTLSERAHNKNVSRFRIHIERAILRIKYFKFFEGCVAYSSFHNLNQVFFIAAFLTLFRKPLINISPVEENEGIENMEEDS